MDQGHVYDPQRVGEPFDALGVSDVSITTSDQKKAAAADIIAFSDAISSFVGTGVIDLGYSGQTRSIERRDRGAD